MSHICGLQKFDNQYYINELDANGSFWKKICIAYRRAILLHPLNPRSKMVFRSSGAIDKERKRQITSKYHYIIHPFSIFRVFWETCMLIVFTLSLIFLPLDVLLNHEADPFEGFSPFVCALDITCCIDIVITFFTGYLDEESNVVILEPRLIAKTYMHHYFVIDFLSSMPSEIITCIIYFFMKKDANIVSLYIKVISLFKIVRVRTTLTYLQRTMSLFDVSFFLIRIAHYVWITFITIHWVGCLTFLIPVFVLYSGKSMTYAEWIYADTTLDDKYSLYINCFFRASGHLLGVDYNYNSKTILDIFIGIVTFCIGHVFKILLFVLVLQMALARNSTHTKYQRLMNEISEYMRNKKLPLDMQKRLVSYYDHRYQKTYFRDNAIMSTLSHIIVTEINLFVHRKLVKNVFILANLPPHLVREVLSSLESELYLPKDIIIKAGAVGECMFFLASGTVTVLTPSGREVCHLEDGSYFGEIALLGKDNRRMADVIAIEVCQVYRLSRNFFMKCIAPEKAIYEKLEYLADTRREQTILIEELHKKYIMEKLTAKRTRN